MADDNSRLTFRSLWVKVGLFLRAFMKKVIEGKEVLWLLDGQRRGYGFITKEGTVALKKCPMLECGLENYALNVLVGICTWCGFDANKL